MRYYNTKTDARVALHIVVSRRLALYGAVLIGLLSFTSIAAAQDHILPGLQIPSFTGTEDGIVRIEGDYVPGYYTAIDFTYNTGYSNPTARIAAYHDGSGSRLVFGTSNHYASGITNSALTIDYGGNVGIGTLGPVHSLHVIRNVADSQHVAVLEGQSPSNYGLRVDIANPTYNRPILELRSGETPTTKVWVGGDGYVGIGTDSPVANLDVVGTMQASVVAITSDARLKTKIAPYATCWRSWRPSAASHSSGMRPMKRWDGAPADRRSV